MTIQTNRDIPTMCLIVAVICIIGSGLVALVAWDVGYLLFGVIATIGVVLWLVLTETGHTREIEKIQIKNGHERDMARHEPISSTYRAIEAPTNFATPMLPAPRRQEELRYIPLLEGGELKSNVLMGKWFYALADGSRARGDLIEAVIDASMTERDTKEPLREYLRRVHKMEFGNSQYTKAIAALRESGALDDQGNWLIEEFDDHLQEMRDHK